MNDMGKPGWQTSEFWTALAGMILPLLYAVFRVPAAEQAPITANVGIIVVGLTAAIPAAAYIWSRTRTKQAAMTTTVVTTVPSTVITKPNPLLP